MGARSSHLLKLKRKTIKPHGQNGDEIVLQGVSEKEATGSITAEQFGHILDTASASADGAKKTVEIGLFYAATVRGMKQDQDRFVVAPELLPGVFLASVFDGHGGVQDGREIAESAASILPLKIRKSLMKCKNRSKTENGNPTSLEEEFVRSCLKDAFLSFQANQSGYFEKSILPPILELKRNMEKETKVELPLILPQTGGCTATTAIIADETLHVGWVGDSKALLCFKHDGQICARPLTEDHSVHNSKERSRAEEAGGYICGNYLSLSTVDGMIQTLRSLGDVAFHRPIEAGKSGALTAEPECIRHKLDTSDLFLMLASDGLWNVFDDAVAASLVYHRLYDEPALATCQDVVEVEAALLRVCKHVIDTVASRVSEVRRGRDDVGLIVVLFTQQWKAHRSERVELSDSFIADTSEAKVADIENDDEGHGALLKTDATEASQNAK